MKITYLEDIEAAIAAGCQVPGCDHKHDPMNATYFHQRCHPGSGVEVFVRHGSGLLEINCRVCKRPVAGIAIATK